ECHQMVATRGADQRAIDKAAAMGGARLILSARGGRYTVRGSVAPITYLVVVGQDGELRCTCQAGQREIPCYHAAAVWLRRAGERASRPTPIQQRSGLGEGIVGRFLEDDQRSPLDFLGATPLAQEAYV